MIRTLAHLIILAAIVYVIYRFIRKKGNGVGGFGIGSGSGAGLFNLFGSGPDTGSLEPSAAMASGSAPPDSPLKRSVNDPFWNKTPQDKLSLANNLADIYRLNQGRLPSQDLWNFRMLVYSLNNLSDNDLAANKRLWLKRNGYWNISEAPLTKLNLTDGNYNQLVSKLQKT